MANAPLPERDARDEEVIWVGWKADYFLKRGWTGQIKLKRFNKLGFSRRLAGWFFS
jgi:hypothetical protein